MSLRNGIRGKKSSLSSNCTLQSCQHLRSTWSEMGLKTSINRSITSWSSRVSLHDIFSIPFTLLWMQSTVSQWRGFSSLSTRGLGIASFGCCTSTSQMRSLKVLVSEPRIANYEFIRQGSEGRMAAWPYAPSTHQLSEVFGDGRTAILSHPGALLKVA